MADQPQGKEEQVAEVVAKVEEQGKDLAVRAETVGDRLGKFFESKQPVPEAETKTQPEPMPSSETTKAEDEAQTTQEPQAQDNEASLPEAASQRTRDEFEKLKKNNRELKERLTSIEAQYGNSVYDTVDRVQTPVQQVVPPVYQPPIPPPDYSYLNQQQVNQIQSQFVSPDGSVDVDGFNRAIAAANQQSRSANDRAYIAETEARMASERIEKFEQSQQVKEAHVAHPELDPTNKEKFDPGFFKLVADRILVNRQVGRNQDLMTIAGDIKQSYRSPNLEKIKEDAINQYKDSLAKRDQGPIEPGRGQPRNPQSEAQLRERTRRGGIDNPALDERLRRAGILKSR